MRTKTTYSLLYRFWLTPSAWLTKLLRMTFKLLWQPENKNCCFVLFVFQKLHSQLFACSSPIITSCYQKVFISEAHTFSFVVQYVFNIYYHNQAVCTASFVNHSVNLNILSQCTHNLCVAVGYTTK
ncbi:MAG: hypothetical protein CM15mV145_230 [uncultured marine virus]|nr:MAG: hypothetical protein CM15mV145_230 [uncultured marine virus]